MPRRRIPPQTWLIVAIASYALGMALAYLFLLRPLFAEVRRVKEESTAAEEYLVLKNTAAQLSLFKEQAAARNRPAAMRAALDTLAAPTGVRVVSVVADTAALPLDAGFLLRGFQVTVEGRYSQIDAFITVLEQANTYYLLTRLNIVRVNERSGLARAQFTLRTLTVPEQKLESPRRERGSSLTEPSQPGTAVRNG